MKIATPISSVEEVEMLAGNGAGELYCGWVPVEWASKYGAAFWLNRRDPRRGNLLSAQALAEITQRARSHDIPVFLTVNAPYYAPEQHPDLIDLMERAIDLGVKGFVVADVGLLLALKGREMGAELHLSSVGSCLNGEALRFYRELGVQRIILPRSLSLKEIERIASSRKHDGDVELEAFALNDGCAFEEGLCQTSHADGGAFCQRDWKYRFFSSQDGTELRSDSIGPLEEHWQDLREWIWYLGGCGPSLSPRGIPNGPCGLCAVPDLKEMGIDALKIAGRQASPLRKLASLQLLRAIVELTRQGRGKGEIQAAARRFRDTKELCQSGYMCYYLEHQERPK